MSSNMSLYNLEIILACFEITRGEISAWPRPGRLWHDINSWTRPGARLAWSNSARPGIFYRGIFIRWERLFFEYSIFWVIDMNSWGHEWSSHMWVFYTYARYPFDVKACKWVCRLEEQPTLMCIYYQSQTYHIKLTETLWWTTWSTDDRSYVDQNVSKCQRAGCILRFQLWLSTICQTYNFITLRKKIRLNQRKLFVWETFFDLKNDWFVLNNNLFKSNKFLPLIKQIISLTIY